MAYNRKFFDHVGEHLATVGGNGIVVEIGARMGHWLEPLMRLHGDKIHKAFTIDIWMTRPRRGFWDVFPAWLKNLEPWAFDKVIPLRGRSQEWGKVLPIRPDILYIDGSHRYPDVLEDCRVWWPLVMPGGIVYFHDLHEPPVKKAITEFFDEQKIDQYYEERWGPRKVPTWWTRKNETAFVP